MMIPRFGIKFQDYVNLRGPLTLAISYKPLILLTYCQEFPNVDILLSWKQTHIAGVVSVQLYPDQGMCVIHAFKSFEKFHLESHILICSSELTTCQIVNCGVPVVD